MAVTLLPTAFAAGNGYSDTQGHWGEDAIDRWSGYGVISGTGNGLFDPSAPLTRAQAAQIFANLLNLSATASVAQYTDVAVGSWYYDAIAKCVALAFSMALAAIPCPPTPMSPGRSCSSCSPGPWASSPRPAPA